MPDRGNGRLHPATPTISETFGNSGRCEDRFRMITPSFFSNCQAIDFEHMTHLVGAQSQLFPAMDPWTLEIIIQLWWGFGQANLQFWWLGSTWQKLATPNLR